MVTKHAALACVLLSLAVICGACGGELDSGSAEPAVRPGKLIVLLTVDTWRGDTLYALPGEDDAFDLVLAEGRVFDRAYSTSNLTSGGVASVLSGLLPRRSGVVRNYHRLPEAVDSIAEMLSRREFATAAFVANPVVGPGFGFEQGFDRYELIEPVEGETKGRGETVWARGAAWLEALPPEVESAFLWLHFMEPHGPYEPPEEWLESQPIVEHEQRVPLLPEPVNAGLGGIPWYQHRGQFGEEAVDPGLFERRYRAEVSRLRSLLRDAVSSVRRERFSEILVALTADHGEALVDDQGFYFSHANGLSEDQVHVPLAFWCDACPPGRESEPVSTTSVVPTVLAWLTAARAPAETEERVGEAGGGTPDQMPNEEPGDYLGRGVDLFGGQARSAPVAQVALQTAIWEGFTKLVWTAGEGRRLYDLDQDPDESSPIASVDPYTSLERELRRTRRLPKIAEPEDRRARAGEHQKRLEALGYTQ